MSKIPSIPRHSEVLDYEASEQKIYGRIMDAIKAKHIQSKIPGINLEFQDVLQRLNDLEEVNFENVLAILLGRWNSNKYKRHFHDRNVDALVTLLSAKPKRKIRSILEQINFIRPVVALERTSVESEPVVSEMRTEVGESASDVVAEFDDRTVRMWDTLPTVNSPKGEPLS